MAPSSNRIEEWLDRMSLDDLIGQMSQIDLNMLLEDIPTESTDNVNQAEAVKIEIENENDSKPPTGKRLNTTKVEYYIGRLGIGSVLNNVVNRHWNASQYRQALVEIQRVAAEHSRPPVLYGLDSVHGANYVHGATVTPQPVNIAATFNATIAYRAGKLASRDTRAAGISWLFSPLVGIAMEPRWSRVYETFGEDPHLVGQMAQAMVQGIQVPDTAGVVPSRAAACAKHFIGYTLPRHGHDRAPSWIPKRHLYQYFVPPWRKVIGEDVLTVMEDYTETSGVPNVDNRDGLQTLLRYQLGFTGMVLTDYAEIWNLVGWHHTSYDRVDAVARSIRSGVDMSMIPFEAESFVATVKEAERKKLLSREQIRQAVRRVMQVKEKLRMMDEVLTLDDENIAKVGTDREEALDMARQSIVLVKNDNALLPLSPNKDLKVLVTGPTADSLSFQSGGWTWQWQGPPLESDEHQWFTYGTTVLEAAQELPWLVAYQCGVDILGNDCDINSNAGVVDKVEGWIGIGGDVPQSIKAATEKDTDYIVVCVGEENYTEKPGDISDLALPLGQVLLVQQLAEKTSAKIILVYFGGRPRLLAEMEPHVDAILVGFLPGPDAGRAVVDIITGEINPSGRLPITYPKHEDLQGIPYFHAVSDECTIGNGRMPHYQYGPCEVQWPFGHGLSYSQFEYSNLQLSSTQMHYIARGQKRSRSSKEAASLQISIEVSNIGDVAGQDTIMFFTFDEARAVTPEYKLLRVFEKVSLSPGQNKTVTATLTEKELQFIGPHDASHLVVQDGMRFRVGVGPWTDCRARPEGALCSDSVTVVASDDYIGACEAACEIWARSPCSDKLSDRACWVMCSAASEDRPGTLKEGWGWPYVNCIESVASQGLPGLTDSYLCGEMTTACRDIFMRNQGGSPMMPSQMSVVLGVTIGSLSALVVALAIRGDLSRMISRIRRSVSSENVEFIPIDQEISID
jgi:beta-glucosidase